MTLRDFIVQLSANKPRAVALVVATIWFNEHVGLNPESQFDDVVNEIEEAGHPKQNRSRLKRSLSTQKSIVKGSRIGTLKINRKFRAELDARYEPLLGHRPPKTSNSVLPMTLVDGVRRQYIPKVVVQLNRSYEESLFDCCAVMCRRLLETLIIELYESADRATELKGADGNFLFFSGLLAQLKQATATGTFNVSRNTLQALADFKKLGDLSAHNRTFNAHKDDIDRARDGLRVAVQELIALASLN